MANKKEREERKGKDLFSRILWILFLVFSYVLASRVLGRACYVGIVLH